MVKTTYNSKKGAPRGSFLRLETVLIFNKSPKAHVIPRILKA